MSEELWCPKGWQIVRFGDVARQVKKKVDPLEAGLARYVAGEHMDTDDLRIRRWGKVGEGYLGPAFTAHFLPGQVLYGSRRTYLRKVAVADFEGVCANTTFVLEPSSGDVLREFLPLIMTSESFHEHSIKQSKGSVNPYINFRDLTWYEFALPPIAEQLRIVEVLRCVDDSTQSYDLAVRSVAVLLEAETSSLVESTAASVVPLSDIADAIYGLTMNAQREELELTLPYLRVANIQRGVLNMSEVKRVGVTPAEAEKFALEYRDILVVEGHADATQVGRSALWIPTSGGEVVLHQNHVMRIRTGPHVLPEYLLGVLNSTYGRRYFISQAKSTSGLNTINSSVLRAFPVPVAEREVQERYVERIAALDEVSACLLAARSSILHLRRTLLGSLLGGASVHRS